MALDWSNADSFTGMENGTPTKGMTVSLHYGHVQFSVVNKDRYWVVEVSIPFGMEAIQPFGLTMRPKRNPAEAVKLRAERVYADQAGAWIAADIGQEILTHHKKKVKND